MKPVAVTLFFALTGLMFGARAQSGRELIEESLQRHAAPAHVYEEQALVLTDRLGQHTVRTARYYARRDASGSRNLLVIETPAELKGATIYVDRETHDGVRRGAAAASSVFGSNFSVADLEGEQPGDFRYERDDDLDLERVPHYVLRAIPADAAVAHRTGYHGRRIYLRKDNLFVSRIDYQDREGRPVKRQTFRDARADESGAWRAGMILMENLRDGQRTLLKVERRVYSPDYVPDTVFAGLQARP